MKNEIITFEDIFLKLLSATKKLKKNLLSILTFSILFALVFYFITPVKTYEAKTTFLLKSNDVASGSGFYGLVSNFGLKSQSLVSFDKISVIGLSDSIITALLQKKIANDRLIGDNLIEEYGFKEKWKNKAPSFLDVDFREPSANRDSILNILIPYVKDNIIINETTQGLIEIVAVSKDEFTAFELNRGLMQLIEDYLYDFEISDQLNSKNVINEKLDSIKLKLANTEYIYAQVKEKSNNSVLFEGYTEVTRVERQLRLLNQMYLEFTTQFELLNFEISKKMSPFKIIDTPRLPLNKSGGSWIFYSLLGAFTGIIFGSLFILLKNYFRIMMDRLKERSLIDG